MEWDLPPHKTVLGYLTAPIRKIFVLHTAHTPWLAGRPFFSVTCWTLFMVRFVRHLTQ